MATQVRTIDFLPEIFKTKSNEQFLAATLDQITQQPDFVKVQGFVGSKFGYGIHATDGYVSEPTKERTDYQLEPAVIFTKKNTDIALDAIPYYQMIDGLKAQGSLVNNHSKLFTNEFYAWDSFTDLDKLINYSQYYWLPQGPDEVSISVGTLFKTLNFTVGTSLGAYSFASDLLTYDQLNPTITLVRGGTYNFKINQNSEFWIQTEPGISGVQADNPNISTREVLGVVGNGNTTGTVTFTVPLSSSQDNNLYTGDQSVDLVTTKKFSDIHGKTLSEIGGTIDGVSNLNQKTLMFYSSSPTATAYRGTFLDEYEFDSDAPGNVQKITIEVTQTEASGNLLHTSSTNDLLVGSDITFSGIPFGGLTVGTTYYIKQIISPTTFTISSSPKGPLDTDNQIVTVTNATTNSNAPMYADVNVGGLEEGKTTTINNNFYRINLIGDNLNPTLYLEEDSFITNDQNIHIKFGNLFVNRTFVRNTFGEILLIPALSANLNTLYYQDSASSNQYGVINIVDDLNSAFIDIEKDILGKKTYISPTGIVFTNGLKVKFYGKIIPVSYMNDSYYVEGVGTGIVLIPVSEQQVPEPFTEGEPIPLDIDGFDIDPYSDSALVPKLQDYITIRRGSKNKNGWSRSNRWFHIETLNTVLKYNSNAALVKTALSDSTSRAKRPIIEFYPDLKLINSGTVGKKPVDFIDLNTTNMRTQVAGKLETSYSPDGSTSRLFSGARIIFANDVDPTVRSQIYIANLIDTNSDSGYEIMLSTASDGISTYNDQTVITKGESAFGKTFYFNGSYWIEGQSKSTVNQPPLFDVFDSNGNSFGDPEYYPGTDFRGNPLFSYAIGSGDNDPILKFPIKYSSITNVGDIVFESTLNTQTFNFVNNSVITELSINEGYVHSYTGHTSYTRLLGWQTAVEYSVQYQVFNLTYTGLPLICDIAANDPASTSWPVITVYEDNIRISDYTYTTTANTTTIELTTPPALGSPVEILIYSDQVSKIGYYQLPSNFDHNPFNEEITTINLGDIRGHYKSICNNVPTLVGSAFGSNNFRDLGNLVPYGTRIIQNSAPLIYPALFTRASNFNFLTALQYNSQQYTKFKIALVNIVENNDYLSTQSDAYVLDDAIDQLTVNRDETNSFFWSDMLPTNGGHYERSYTFNNSVDSSVFPLTRLYDFTTANYFGILIYLTRKVNGIARTTQLVKDIDYTINANEKVVRVSTDLLPNDVILIKEFNQTYGSFVPNTPTKLGFYPSFIPEVVLDNTYLIPTYFIKGHDGSLTKLHGDYVDGFLTDNRDRALLEFEKRIFNNLKVKARIPVEYDEVFPGQFRKTDFDIDEINVIYSTQFLNWAGNNNIDYITQTYFNTNEFTWNYKNSKNKLDGSTIKQGHWRGVYLWMYDTATPHITPWEMLGLYNKPIWWDARYGEAPYTSENLLLWEDISNGLIWNNGNSYVNERRIRPNLLDVLPVDTAGTLLSPFTNLLSSYNQNSFKNNWNSTDVGPAEYSYRKSSSWPFDLMRIFALTKPAQFFSLGIDLDVYKYNTEFNQYLIDNRKRQTISNIGVYGSGNAKHSYLNWIIGYTNQYGVNAHDQLVDYINEVDVRLVYRLAGYSDKALVKFFAEKGSPNSKNNSLLIPDESYSILLNETQPTKTIIYSSLIIQKTSNGYRIYGNDKDRKYFVASDPREDGRHETITIGAQTVNLAVNFFDTTSIYPYGYEFTSIISMLNFINGYGNYLKSTGITFSNIENGIEINWKQMAVEVLYWIDSGWEDGSIINLNPNASTFTVTNDIGVVQSLTDSTTNYILNQNLIPLSLKDLSITRLGTSFTVTALNPGDAISFFKSNIIGYEHIVVFDNTTVFNDTIFNLKTGLRQQRLFMKGSKTAQWNGTLNAPGFIINQDNIPDWAPNTRYSKGSMVVYKNKYWSYLPATSNPSSIFKYEEWNSINVNNIQTGMLPNASTRAREASFYYDTTVTNLKSDADLLGFSLIGYRPRNYFSEINLDDITQVNLYKSMIVNKGAKNSLDILSGATLQESDLSYTFHENWAIKQADYGGKMNQNFIEVTLDEAQLLGNPAILSITNGISIAGTQQELHISELKNYGVAPKDTNLLPTIPSTTESKLPTAGYVNINDVLTYAYYPGLLDGGAISNLYKNDYIWVADVAGEWKVYTPVPLGVKLITVNNSLNNLVTFVFDKPHNLVENDLFGVINFDPNINGYYTVISVASLTSLIVIKNLDASINSLTGIGIAFKLINQRVQTAKDILGLPLLNAEYVKNKVWLDYDANGEWNVLEKTNNYTYKTSKTPTLSTEYGSTVAVIKSGYLVADTGVGKVYYYNDSPLSDIEWSLHTTLSKGAGFGTAMVSNDDIIVISKPDPFGDLSQLFIYRLVSNDKVDTLVEEQILTFYNGMFGAGIEVGAIGTSLAFSGDGNYLYVSATDLVIDGAPTVGLFFTFQLDQSLTYYDVGFRLSSAISPGSNQFSVYGDIGNSAQGRRISFTAFGITDDVYTIVASVYNSSTSITTIYVYETIPYTVSTGSAMYLGVLNYTQIGAVSSEGLSGYQDKFGYSLTTNYDGTRLFVGSPLADWSYPTTINTGFVFSYTRLVESWEVVGDSPLHSVALFFIEWTPNYGSAVYINDVRVNPAYYLLISNVLVTFLELKSGDIITVSSGNVELMQRLQGPDTVEEFQSGEQFGFSMDCNTSGADLIVGSPNNLDKIGNEGAVFRFSNEGKRTGVITGLIPAFLLVPVDILINGFRVQLPDPNPFTGIVGDAFYIANRINLSVVNNVFAYASEDGRLHIRLRDENLGPANNKLNITVFGSYYLHTATFTGDGSTVDYTLGFYHNPSATDITVLYNDTYLPPYYLDESGNVITLFSVSGDVLTFNGAPEAESTISVSWNELLASPSTVMTSLGISEYIHSEYITDPRPNSRTSFGYSVKFNEFNSFIVGAPTTDRYLNTTFDFTDDENNHNDCVFDNNFTQWEDIYQNAGTAYIYEYIDNYNESLLNLGNYVYAQSLPDLSTSYGQQPYYGSSVSLRNHRALVGAPKHKSQSNSYTGRAVAYHNLVGSVDWAVLRKSNPITDINKIQKVQLFDNQSNITLDSLDYFDPLQGKLLGSVASNLDYITSVDPAGYNNSVSAGNIVWSTNKIGTLWFDISSTKFINYHQDDIVYNSKYWGAVFPGSRVTVYSWIESSVLPINYIGSGTPYDFASYSMAYSTDAGGNLNVKYYYWVRNTNVLFTEQGKTLTDTVLENYITDPHGSGISYFTALATNAFGLYNIRDSVNGTKTNLHVGFSLTDKDIPVHTEFSLVRADFPTDFLPGFPDGKHYLVPEGLYKKLLESFAGQDDLGQVLPNPLLPELVQIGTGVRPSQTMFINRSLALQNYLGYANRVMKANIISELPNLTFLNLSGDNFDTSKYWEYVYWWADGFTDSTKTRIEVDTYYTLLKEVGEEGLLAGVRANSQGKREVYQYTSGEWVRIGLEDGTIQFLSTLWNPVGDNIGFGDDFFDSTTYDAYPATETKNIIRALNEQIFVGDLILHRNNSLILMFEYIQSENIESHNYLPWLTKTSLADVSYKIRNLLPYQKYQTENTNLLEGFINEVKPYHTVLKDFYFTYSGIDTYSGTIADFDLSATFNTITQKYESPKLLYTNINTEANIPSTDAIWSSNNAYNTWINNYGLSLYSEANQPVTVLAKYVEVGSIEIFVQNARGLPVTGLIKLDNEYIQYTSIDRETGRLFGLVRGFESSVVTTHYPGIFVYMDKLGVEVISTGRYYVDPPIVKAYVDTTKYPAPIREASLRSILVGDKVVGVEILDPGAGYVVPPEIIFESVYTLPFNESKINFQSNLIIVETDNLNSGDLIKINSLGNSFESIDPGYYYVSVLGYNARNQRILKSAKPVITLHLTYKNAISGDHRVVFRPLKLSQKVKYTLEIVPRVVTTTKNTLVRGIKTTLRFDRTSYQSAVIPWESGVFWPSVFNSLGNDASSNLTLDYATEFAFDQYTATLDSTATFATVSGLSLKFSVFNQKSSGEYYVTITSPGTGYRVGETITITGDNLGGTTPHNDIVITITAIAGSGGPSGPVSTVSFAGDPYLPEDFSPNDSVLQNSILTASLQGSVMPIVSAYSDPADATAIIQVNFTPSSLKPGQLKGLRAYFYRYLPPYTYNDTGSNFTATIEVGPTSTFQGTIVGTKLTVNSAPTGSGIKIGDMLTGGAIATDIHIVKNLTGTSTSTNSSWTISSSVTQNTTVTLTVTPVTMTVTAVTRGKLSVGQLLTGTGLTANTKITGLVTGTTGGTGLYKVSKSQTVSTPTLIQTNGGAIIEIHRPEFDPQVTVNRYYIKIIDSGSIYYDGDVIIIPGGLLGGVSGTNDAVIDIIYANNDTGEIQVSKVSGIAVGYVKIYYVYPQSATELRIYNDAALLKPTPFTDFIYTSDGTYDFAYLPEPLLIGGGYKYVASALVSYKNKVYRCIESNSDDVFDYAKWKEINIDDRDLNAIDRVIGYYQPTLDMPAKDLGQLLLGVTNPNPTYLGNSFAPDEVLPLDIAIKDDRFYPRDIKIKRMISYPVVEIQRFIGDETTTDFILNESTSSVLEVILEGVTLTEIDDYSIYQHTLSFVVPPALGSLIQVRELIRTEHVGIGDTYNQSSVISSSDGVTWGKSTLIDWSIKDLHLSNIGVTGIAFNGYLYVVTTTNRNTPLLVSYDKANWVTTGDQITFDYAGYGDLGYDEIFVSAEQTPLNAIINVGESFIACGMYHIIKSDDGVIWETVYTNSSRLYQNLNDIKYIESRNFEGYIAVGVGNKVISGKDTAAPEVQSYGKVMTSVLGIEWKESTVNFTTSELYAITSSSTLLIVVGDNGEIWSSTNSANWNKITLSSPITTTLRDIIYANNMFIIVGDNGVILKSSNGYTWTNQNDPTRFTNNLLNISYDGTYFFIVGENGAMFRSVNGIFWTDISNIASPKPIYNIQGSDFLTGYGPEEMIPGVISDTISMRVHTRPGGWWDIENVSQSKIYGYTGFNMISRIDSSGDTVLSFIDMVKNPAQLAVFILNNDTMRGYRIYETNDYTIDWIAKEISLIDSVPANSSILIEVYEIGNGNQVARSTSDYVPFRLNSITNNTEIGLDVGYILLETPIVYHNGSRLEYGVDYTVDISENNLLAIIFEQVYDPAVDFISYAILQDSTTISDFNDSFTGNHFGYSIPETEVFIYSGINTFTLNNYIGGDNIANAIIEKNGYRLDNSDWSITSSTLTVTASLLTNDVIAVTTFNDTKRQYLNTDAITSFKNVSISYVDTTTYVNVTVVFLGDPGFVTGDNVIFDGFSSTQLNNIQVYLNAQNPFTNSGNTYYPYTVYIDSGLSNPILSKNVSIDPTVTVTGYVTKVNDLIDITVTAVSLLKTGEDFYVVPSDENRTWVTINGERVDTNQLRFIPGENSTKLNILTSVSLGDKVVITSMVPGATPNSDDFLLDINKTHAPSVYQSNENKTTWLVASRRSAGGSPDFIESDDTIYMHNVSNVIHSDTNIIQINGEKIRFTTVDYVENTLSGLTRGIEGSAQRKIHSVNETVYSISNTTKLANEQYNKLWYNKQSGDPIQLSDNIATRFLNIGLK